MFDLAATIEALANATFAAVMLGSIFAIMCTGVGLIYGVMGVVNFAQGEFMTLGMYIAFFVVTQTSGWLITPVVAPYLAAICAGIVVFPIGFILFRLLLSRLTGMRARSLEGAGHNGQLILTLGLSILMANSMLLLFGSDPRSVRAPLSDVTFVVNLTPSGDELLFLNANRIVIAGIALALCAGLYLFIQKTPVGRSLRAASDNTDAATYLGIDVDKSFTFAFSLGVAITAIGGALLATYYVFQPYIGADYIIIMYAGVVLGGMGRIGGAFFGGMFIAFVQQFSSIVLPMQLQTTSIFVLFILTLLLRPQGFFGRVVDRA